jgi:hypothetical protein
MEPKRGLVRLEEKMEVREERTVYFNRRAELYGELSLLLDPAQGHNFGIGREHEELLRQLKLIPKKYDGEGRLVMIPKNNPRDENDPRTLKKLLGCSPDEADSLVLACYAMRKRPLRPTAGAA